MDVFSLSKMTNLSQMQFNISSIRYSPHSNGYRKVLQPSMNGCCKVLNLTLTRGVFINYDLEGSANYPQQYPKKIQVPIRGKPVATSGRPGRTREVRQHSGIAILCSKVLI